MIDLRPADGDWWGGLGGDAVAKASHVSLRSSDLEVVVGVRLKVWDDSLSQTSINFHLLSAILHLEEGRGIAIRIKGKKVKMGLHSASS